MWLHGGRQQSLWRILRERLHDCHSGTIQTRKYEDKSGNKRTSVEIVADNVSFCGSKIGSGKPNLNVSNDDFEEIGNDDLPF